MKWVLSEQYKDKVLYRNFNKGTSSIPGFLEDYAHVIDACIAMYQVTFQVKWLMQGKEWMEECISAFGDEDSKMFFFTNTQNTLIARKMEVNDNVIPSSNSVMARNLYYLGRYFHRTDYIGRARTMLGNVYDGIEQYGSGYSNWAMLLLHEVYGLAEVVTMPKVEQPRTIQKEEGVFVLAAVYDKNLPMTAEKNDANERHILVCFEGTCQRPTDAWSEAIEQVYQR
jgi:uncharacterized protein YyaL (SSP411 family)